MASVLKERESVCACLFPSLSRCPTPFFPPPPLASLVLGAVFPSYGRGRDRGFGQDGGGQSGEREEGREIPAGALSILVDTQTVWTLHAQSAVVGGWLVRWQKSEGKGKGSLAAQEKEVGLAPSPPPAAQKSKLSTSKAGLSLFRIPSNAVRRSRFIFEPFSSPLSLSVQQTEGKPNPLLLPSPSAIPPLSPLPLIHAPRQPTAVLWTGIPPASSPRISRRPHVSRSLARYTAL